MKSFQGTLTAAIAVAALAGSFSLSASAQAVTPQGPAAQQTAPHHGHRAKPVDFAKFHAERADRLKTLLQLQPNQQAAWDKYVKATTPAPRAKPAGERPDLRKLSTPERLDLAQKLRKERAAHAEQRDQATRAFYSSLNSSQQKAFDVATVRQPGKHKAGPGARGHHGHGPQHGHGPAAHPAAPTAAPVGPAA